MTFTSRSGYQLQASRPDMQANDEQARLDSQHRRELREIRGSLWQRFIQKLRPRRTS